jgi:hypothetical protein
MIAPYPHNAIAAALLSVARRDRAARQRGCTAGAPSFLG